MDPKIRRPEIIKEMGKKSSIKEILYRLSAAKGGDYIMSSDHSVAGNVPPENYEYMVNLVREYGNYPLKVEEDLE